MHLCSEVDKNTSVNCPEHTPNKLNLNFLRHAISSRHFLTYVADIQETQLAIFMKDFVSNNFV